MKVKIGEQTTWTVARPARRVRRVTRKPKITRRTSRPIRSGAPIPEPAPVRSDDAPIWATYHTVASKPPEPAPKPAPVMRQVNREYELRKFLPHGLDRIHVIWVNTFGRLEEIAYYTDSIPDPITLACWLDTADDLNWSFGWFQMLRQDATRLAAEGPAYLSDVILPTARRAGLNLVEQHFIRQWCQYVLDRTDTIPVPRPTRRFTLSNGLEVECDL